MDKMHTGSFSQNSFQIDVIIECSNLKFCHFCFIIVEISLYKKLKLIRVRSGFILKKKLKFLGGATAEKYRK